MKKIVIATLALGGLIFNSCSTDPCKDKTAAVTCTGHGTPVANNSTCDCVCDAGYSGTNCSTLDVTSAIGSYAQVSTALFGAATNARTGTTVIVQDGSNIARVKITNLNQFFGCTNGGTTTDVICYATLSNAEMVLEETAQCGVTFKGKGVKSGTGWKFTYTAANSTATYTCETTLTK